MFDVRSHNTIPLDIEVRVRKRKFLLNTYEAVVELRMTSDKISILSLADAKIINDYSMEDLVEMYKSLSPVHTPDSRTKINEYW